MEVKPELSGWRDEWISNKHREWGWDCPFIDFDFLGLEYDRGQAVILIEYKTSRKPNGQPTAPPDFSKANYKTLRNVANKLEVPLFIVHYNKKWRCFKVFPGNEPAQYFIKHPKETLSEFDFVTLLYAVRKRLLPDDIGIHLSRENPWQFT